MGELKTVMQTRDEVKGLHNCGESGYANTRKKFSIAFRKWLSREKKNTPLGQSECAYYLSYFLFSFNNRQKLSNCYANIPLFAF